MQGEVVDVGRARRTEDERVLSWRREWLERVGYCQAVAQTIAARPDIDLHLAVTLPRSGCPLNTALRILL